MNLKPINRIIVQRDTTEDLSPGGICIPTEKPTTGTVVASAVRSVSDGDRVLFNKYSGVEVFYEGSEYVVLLEENIVGVLDE